MAERRRWREPALAVGALWAIFLLSGKPAVDTAGIVDRAAPSPLEAILTGRFVASPDTAATLGLVHDARKALRRGEVKLWNEHVGSGRPLYPIDGYNTGALDPLQWLACLLFPSDTNRAIALVTALYGGLILLALFAWLGQLGLSPGGTAVAAAVLFSHAYFQWFAHFHLYLAQFAILFSALWLLGRLARVQRMKDALATGAALGLLFVNALAFAFPQVTGLWVLWGVARSANGSAPSRREAGLAALALALGLALSAGHLLAAREMASLSTNPLFSYLGYGFDPLDGLKSVFWYGSRFPALWWLAAAGLLSGARREAPAVPRGMAAAALFAAWLGLSGALDPLCLALGMNLQPLNTFGPVLVVGMCLASARGAELFLSGRLSAKASLAGAILVGGAELFYRGAGGLPQLVLALAAGLFLGRRRPDPLCPSAGLAPFAAGSLLLALAGSFQNGMWLSYLTGLVMPFRLGQAMRVLAPILWLAGKARSGGIASLRSPTRLDAAAALVAFFAWVTPFLPRNAIFEAPLGRAGLPAPLAEARDQAGSLHRAVSVHPPRSEDPRLPAPLDYAAAERLPVYPLTAPALALLEASGSASLTPRLYSDFVDYGNYGAMWGSPAHPAEAYREEYVQAMRERRIWHYEKPYGEMAQIKRNNVLVWNPTSGLWRYNAIRFLFSSFPLPDHPRLLRKATLADPVTLGRALAPGKRFETLYVYEYRGAYPRAYLPDVLETVTDWGEAELRRLESHASPARLALVQPSRPGERPEHGPHPLSAIESVVDGTNRVTIRARLERPAVVVLSDTYYPGWRARVNDRPVPVWRANYAFRAVQAPAGEVEIVFTFLPPALVKGALISLVAFVLAGIAGLVIALRTQRISRSASTTRSWTDSGIPGQRGMESTSAAARSASG